MDDIFVDLRAAGLPTPSSRQGREDLAKQLGFSYKHLDNVMSARKPYGGRLRDAIRGSLVVDKQTIDVPAPLSPLNQVIPEPVIAPVIERAEASSATKFENDEIYHVVANADGGWDVVEKVWVVHHSIVARIPSGTAGEDNAKRIAELLNKEAG